MAITFRCNAKQMTVPNAAKEETASLGGPAFILIRVHSANL